MLRIKGARVLCPDSGLDQVMDILLEEGKVAAMGNGLPEQEGETVIDQPMEIDGEVYPVTLVSMGNPHCVIFSKKVDDVPVQTLGPKIENSKYFPGKTNVEFIRVVNEYTIKMRVWERGNGETWGCGTGAAAAAVACVLKGFCKKDTDITVKLRGGDLIVRYRSDGRVILTGNVQKIYEGKVAF